MIRHCWCGRDAVEWLVRGSRWARGPSGWSPESGVEPRCGRHPWEPGVLRSEGLVRASLEEMVAWEALFS